MLSNANLVLMLRRKVLRSEGRFLRPHKLVTDKKATLTDISLQVSMTLVSHPEFSAYITVLQSRMLQEHSTVETFQSTEYPFPNFLLWRRRTDKGWSEENREWKVVEEHVRHKPVVGMVYAASELHNAYPKAAQDVVVLKSALPEGYRILVFVDGVEAFLKGRPAEPHSKLVYPNGRLL